MRSGQGCGISWSGEAGSAFESTARRIALVWTAERMIMEFFVPVDIPLEFMFD